MEPVLKSRKASLDDEVSIICYNETKPMIRRDAIAFYFEGMMCCEGSERERYTNIYQQLMLGWMECDDSIYPQI